MSKSEVLYVKDLNISESEGDEDDPWDDKKLNDAYDKAVRIANVEVAKRVAMSTNTPSATTEPVFFSKKDKSSSLTSYSSTKKDTMSSGKHNIKTSETPKDIKWQAGMPCRLVYMEDGMEYEAVFLRSIENDECIVKYLGYETQEIVQIDMLKPSLGEKARSRQIKDAQRLQTEDSFDRHSNVEAMETSDRVLSPDSVDRSSQRKKKSPKKKKTQSRNIHMNGFDLPEMPPMPNLSMLRNQLGSTEMPMPPPPMTFSSLDRTDSEEQAISSMLLSWYMSGYYTGLYQGLKSLYFTMEDGFVKAESTNLPMVNTLMVAKFFASNPDFCSAELRNVKTAMAKEGRRNV